MAPFADILYFADVRWEGWHKNRPEFRAFAGELVSIENGGSKHSDPRVIVMKNLSVVGGTMGRLSTDHEGIYTGQNSGYQAVNVAVLMGAKKIVLLGYDMRLEGGSPKGKSHFFGDHPIETRAETFRQFRTEFQKMAPTAAQMGVEIVNATPGSELEAFPMVDLEDCIE